jgi:hypothetical protein
MAMLNLVDAHSQAITGLEVTSFSSAQDDLAFFPIPTDCSRFWATLRP